MSNTNEKKEDKSKGTSYTMGIIIIIIIIIIACGFIYYFRYYKVASTNFNGISSSNTNVIQSSDLDKALDALTI